MPTQLTQQPPVPIALTGIREQKKKSYIRV